MSMRPTVLEVSKGALEHNYRAIAAEAARGSKGKARVICVVKADGYGTGIVQAARWLREFGVDFFGVATPDEALTLRQNGFGDPVLVLGTSPANAAEFYVKEGVRSTITDLGFAKALSEAAAKLGKTAKVHIKMDSGMGRIGFLCEDAPSVAEKVAALPGLEIEGLFTHFSRSDEASQDWTHEQFRRFSAAVAEIRAKGIAVKMTHCCNSGALMAGLRDYYCDYVRPGHILYGLTPSRECGDAVDIRPVVTFKTRVGVARDLPEGWGVSYGQTYHAGANERIAVLPVGYADGFPRAFSNKGEVLIHGQRCPILGRVCMDQCVAGVGHLEGVETGDEVVLVGRQGDQEISVLDYAERAGTITGALATTLTPRVPRVYVD